jgi:uncharacterized membrane protein SirB2
MATASTLSRPRVAASARPAARWRLSRTFKQLTVLVHILTSVGLFGMTIVSVALATIASATNSDPAIRRAVLQILETLDQVLLPPTALGALVTGVVLSIGTHWGLFNHFWILTKLVLTVAVIVTGATVIKNAVSASIGVITRPDFATPGGGVLGSPLFILLTMYSLHLALLGAATAITVFKPWGMTPHARAAAAAMKPG